MKLLVVASFAALAVTIGGCGYKPLRAGLEGKPRIRVVHAMTHAPGGADADVVAETEQGARGELSRFGALADGDGGDVDRLEIEVVRVDERSEGAMVVDGRPRARGVVLRVTARGDVEGHGARFTTPDVDATEVVATPGDVLGFEGARTAAVRTAARKAGAMIAREVLGVP